MDFKALSGGLTYMALTLFQSTSLPGTKGNIPWGPPNTTLCIGAHPVTCHPITEALPDCISPLSVTPQCIRHLPRQLRDSRQYGSTFSSAPPAGDTGPCKDLMPCQWELPRVTRTTPNPTLPFLVSYLLMQRSLLPSPGCKVSLKEPLKGIFPNFLQEFEQTVSIFHSILTAATPKTLPLQTLSQRPHHHIFCSLLQFVLFFQVLT